MSFWLVIVMTFYNPNTDTLVTDELSIGEYTSAVVCENKRVSETQRLFQEYSRDIWDSKGFFAYEVESYCVESVE